MGREVHPIVVGPGLNLKQGSSARSSLPTTPPILGAPASDPGVRWVAWLVLVAALGMGWLLRWEGWPNVVPQCGFHALTHLPCPLCGSTRAFAAAFRGDWGSALVYNPLALLVGVLSVAWAGMAACGLRCWRLSRWARGLISRRAALGCAVVLVVVNWLYLLLWAAPFRRF